MDCQSQIPHIKPQCIKICTQMIFCGQFVSVHSPFKSDFVYNYIFEWLGSRNWHQLGRNWFEKMEKKEIQIQPMSMKSTILIRSTSFEIFLPIKSSCSATTVSCCWLSAVGWASDVIVKVWSLGQFVSSISQQSTDLSHRIYHTKYLSNLILPNKEISSLRPRLP